MDKWVRLLWPSARVRNQIYAPFVNDNFLQIRLCRSEAYGAPKNSFPFRPSARSVLAAFWKRNAIPARWFYLLGYNKEAITRLDRVRTIASCQCSD